MVPRGRACAVPDSDDGEGPLAENGWFLDRPEMVLGAQAWTSSVYAATTPAGARRMAASLKR